MGAVLITGATGNVGSQIAKILREEGHEVRLAVQASSVAKLAGDPDVRIFDFKDQSTYGPALDGVDRVFLMRPPDMTDVKQYIQPFVAYANTHSVKQIAFMSLIGAANNNFVPHHKVEVCLQEMDAPWTFLRPSFFMQNLNTNHLAEIRDLHAIYVPAGNGKTSFIDVRDIAAVGAKVLTEEGHLHKAYDLTGSEALTYGEVASIMSDVLGFHIEYKNPSLLSFARFRKEHGDKMGFILVMMGIYTTARLGLAGSLSDEVQHLLGRDPIRFRRFVEDFKASWL